MGPIVRPLESLFYQLTMLARIDRNFSEIGRRSRSQYNGWVQCVDRSAGESGEKVKCIQWLLSTSQDSQKRFFERMVLLNFSRSLKEQFCF